MLELFLFAVVGGLLQGLAVSARAAYIAAETEDAE